MRSSNEEMNNMEEMWEELREKVEVTMAKA